MYKVWVVIGEKEFLVLGDNEENEVSKAKAEEFLDIMKLASGFSVDLADGSILTVPLTAMINVHFIAKPSK